MKKPRLVRSGLGWVGVGYWIWFFVLLRLLLDSRLAESESFRSLPLIAEAEIQSMPFLAIEI